MATDTAAPIVDIAALRKRYDVKVNYSLLEEQKDK